MVFLFAAAHFLDISIIGRFVPQRYEREKRMVLKNVFLGIIWARYLFERVGQAECLGGRDYKI